MYNSTNSRSSKHWAMLKPSTQRGFEDVGGGREWEEQPRTGIRGSGDDKPTSAAAFRGRCVRVRCLLPHCAWVAVLLHSSMQVGGGGVMGLIARPPVWWGREGAGQLRQSCVQCLQMNSGEGRGAEASPAKLSPAAIMAAAVEIDEDQSSEDDDKTVIQMNAGWAAGNRARMRAFASRAWETVTLSREPTRSAPSALGSLGSSRGPGAAVPAPTSSAMSLATQSYLSSLYRLDTDDGRRLSAISRYADDYWISNLLTLMRSRVFQCIFSRLAVCSAVCAVVSIFYIFFPFAPFARGQAHATTKSPLYTRPQSPLFSSVYTKLN